MITQGLALGIDGGASATKWTLRNAKGPIAEGISQATDGHVYRDESRARLLGVLNEIKVAAGGEKITSIYAGITGVGEAGSNTLIEKLFIEIFPNAKIKIVIDMELGYRSHFLPGAGIFLYAGTGSIALHINTKDEVIRAGGWGYLLGDEGAGYWIGREGIRTALYDIDEKKTINDSSLSGKILAAINSKNWDEVRTFVYSQERSAVAALAQIVINQSNLGNLDGKRILNRAAQHLSQLVLQIEKQIGKSGLPIIFCGGITNAGQPFIEEINKNIGRPVSVSKIRMADKAAAIAAENIK